MIKDYFSDIKNRILFLLAVLLRIVFVLAIINNGLWCAPDTPSYILPCAEMLSKGTFTINGVPEILRTPLYPAFICICMLISEDCYYVVVQVVQQLVGLAVFFCWRHFLRLFLKDKRTWFIGECIYLFNIQFIFYGCMVLTDFLFACMIIVLADLFVVFWRTGNNKYFMGAVLILIIIPLLRPIALYLPFAMGFGFLIVYMLSKRDWKRGITYAFVISTLAVCTIGGWSYRNYRVGGIFNLSNITQQNTYVYNAPAIESELTGRSYYEIVDERLSDVSQKDFDFHTDEVYEKGEGLIKNHPLIYAKICIRDIVLEFLYPGVNDILRSSSKFSEGIGYIKELMIKPVGFVQRFLSIIQYVMTDNIVFLVGLIIIIVDCLGLFCLMIGFLMSILLRWSELWYEKWMLIGMLMYFVVCSAAPLGIGSFSRFRMAFFYIMLLGCGISYEQKGLGKVKV